MVVGGVDTHGQTHHAAVIDRSAVNSTIGSSRRRRRAIAPWLDGLVIMETSTRSASRAPAPTGPRWPATCVAAGSLVVEVDRPDRKSRRAHGKSDPLDAYAAARAVLSGAAAVVPKLRDGRVEAIRALRVARSSAVKARSQATNQIKALIVTGPAELREQLRHLRTPMLIATCARLRPGQQLGDPEVIAAPTTRSTLSSSTGSVTTHAVATMPNAVPTKASPSTGPDPGRPRGSRHIRASS